jgi:hypothetical protein
MGAAVTRSNPARMNNGAAARGKFSKIDQGVGWLKVKL